MTPARAGRGARARRRRGRARRPRARDAAPGRPPARAGRRRRGAPARASSIRAVRRSMVRGIFSAFAARAADRRADAQRGRGGAHLFRDRSRAGQVIEPCGADSARLLGPSQQTICPSRRVRRSVPHSRNKGDSHATQRIQDPREPEGRVRRRIAGQPPLPLLRSEGGRRGPERRRGAVPLDRRGRDRARARPPRVPGAGGRPGHRPADRPHRS